MSWKLKLSLLLACLNNLHVSSMSMDGRAGHGLIGYGISMYNPQCAFACRSSISSSSLNCSTMEGMAMEGMDMGMGETETTPECYATDDAFLQTLAWCISTHCADIPSWKLERYWTMNVAGTAKVQPDPKASFQETLANITGTPTEILGSGEPLNKTSLVSEEDFLTNWNGMSGFEVQENTHERYGYALCLVIPNL